MPTTYKSNLIIKKMRHRGLYSGQPNSVGGRIFLASGTVLGVGDILLSVPVGENQRIKKVSVLAIGDTGLAAGSVGRFQILDAQGNPAVVKRHGPFSETADTYTSPATSGAEYAAAAQLDGFVETDVLGTAMTKLAGPANVGVIITTGGTVGADTEVYINATFDGETSILDTIGSAAPSGDENDYLLVKG